MPLSPAVRRLVPFVSIIHATGLLLCIFASQLVGGGSWSMLPWVGALFFSLAFTALQCFSRGWPWSRQAAVVTLAITSALILLLPYLSILIIPFVASSGGSAGGMVVLGEGAATLLTGAALFLILLFFGVLPLLSGRLLYLTLREENTACRHTALQVAIFGSIFTGILYSLLAVTEAWRFVRFAGDEQPRILPLNFSMPKIYGLRLLVVIFFAFTAVLAFSTAGRKEKVRSWLCNCLALSIAYLLLSARGYLAANLLVAATHAWLLYTLTRPHIRAGFS